MKEIIMYELLCDTLPAFCLDTTEHTIRLSSHPLPARYSVEVSRCFDLQEVVDYLKLITQHQ